MSPIRNPEAIETLEGHVENYDLVLVPGFKNSPAEHWQTLWEQKTPLFSRISMSRWDVRDIHYWIDAINRQLSVCEKPVILIGHSLGALAAACVLAETPPEVAGAMFVAPAEPMRFEAEDIIPHHRLDRPTVLVASHDDQLISLGRTKQLAATWGSAWVDLGNAGHINAESGFGRWPYGLTILADLVERIEQAP